MRRSTVKKWLIIHLGAILLGLCSPLAKYLTSFFHIWTSLGSSLIFVCIFLLSWIPVQRSMTTHIMGWCLLPLESFCTCVVEETSLTSGMRDVVLLSLYSSTVQVLPLTLCLEYLRKIKFQFDKLSQLNSWAHLSPNSVGRKMRCEDKTLAETGFYQVFSSRALEGFGK